MPSRTSSTKARVQCNAMTQEPSSPPAPLDWAGRRRAWIERGASARIVDLAISRPRTEKESLLVSDASSQQRTSRTILTRRPPRGPGDPSGCSLRWTLGCDARSRPRWACSGSQPVRGHSSSQPRRNVQRPEAGGGGDGHQRPGRRGARRGGLTSSVACTCRPAPHVASSSAHVAQYVPILG